MKQPVNIAILGLGWPGRMHAQAIDACPTTHLAAACDLDAGRRTEFQTQYPGAAAFDDYQKMLSMPDIDAVIVGLPNFLHYQMTLDGLKAGKHVLCEKPPTMHAGEMAQLKEEAERQGKVYMFGRQMRFDRHAVRARRIVQEGRLGEIYYSRTGWIRSRGIPGGLDGWFTQKKRSGGGALIDLGVHCLDDAWFLMGCPKPVTVTGRASKLFAHTSRNPDQMDVDDVAFATVRFENQAMLHLEVSWAGNYPGEYDPSGQANPDRPPAKRDKRFTTLFGTKGTVSVRPFELVEEIGGIPSDVDLSATPRSQTEDLFLDQMQNFSAACRGVEAPLNTAEQALELMEMLDAIYKSSETGREVVVAH